MTSHIIESRKHKLTTEVDALRILKEGDLILPTKAKETGLIDNIINPDQYVLETFGKDVVIDTVSKNWKQKLGI